MGIWIEFNFGFRLSEIIHLRIQDIDFRSNEIYVRPHSQTLNQKAWNPKYNRSRQIPITEEQSKTFKKWINETREYEKLNHPYLLWTPRTKTIVHKRNFQRWCKKTGLTPHILCYSFATHWYNESKDVKLISELLGHSNVATTSKYLQLDQEIIMNRARELFNR